MDIWRKYKLVKGNIFLKRHGCQTWAEYNHKFDSDINKMSDRIKAYYMNYPYVYVINPGTSAVFTSHSNWEDAYMELKLWCDTNVNGKWRNDIHRVLPSNYFTDPRNADRPDDYIMNDIGGYDFVFFAFMNEADYIWFVTRWG